jgi:DNA-binding helix-hairpin-helix protein with protein kinase domain
MAPPVGLPLGTEHVIGRLIGKGAFGSVHAVDVVKGSKSRKSSTTQWACKLTAVPVKATKKQNSETEIAYMRLWAENLIYSAQCRSLTGTLLPKLPGKMQDGLVHFYDKVGGTSRLRVVV